MKKIRLIFLAVILVGGSLLSLLIYRSQVQTPYESTLAPFYQALGIVPNALDRSLGRLIPVDSLDEAAYGEGIKQSFLATINPADSDYLYVNRLRDVLEPLARKPFSYRFFIVDYGFPNAFAMPKGVIFVTRSLLGVLQSESELVSILAHEMAHIELSHCFDLVRFELLAEKSGKQEWGQILDWTIQFFFAHAYSKTMEDEADMQGFAYLLQTDYTPCATAAALVSLDAYLAAAGSQPAAPEADLFRDYFMSHPPLRLRSAKFRAEATRWWRANSAQTRYRGEASLRARRTLAQLDYGVGEWQQGGCP